MSNTNLFIGLAVISALFAGMILAQHTQHIVPLQGTGEDGHDWAMFSENVATSAGTGLGGSTHGESFLYNKRTGKVFRHSYRCGSAVPAFAAGCLIPIPAASGSANWDNLNDSPDGTWEMIPTPTGKEYEMIR